MPIETGTSPAPKIKRAGGNYVRVSAAHHPDNPEVFSHVVLDQRAHGVDYRHLLQVQVEEQGQIKVLINETSLFNVTVVNAAGVQVYPAP